MVRGSDLDLVVLMDDAAPKGLAKRLDDGHLPAEVSVSDQPLVARRDRLHHQAAGAYGRTGRFRRLQEMVPCKIMDEAILLYGSERLLRAAKGLLVRAGISERSGGHGGGSRMAREKAERHLLGGTRMGWRATELYLFYTSEETDEFD